LVRVHRLDSAPRPPNLRRMSPSRKRPKNPTADKLRAWRVEILRNRSQYIGDVQAANEKAAEAAAIAEFNLDDEQRKRLVVRERD
jgi:hypothetical protein